MIREGKETKDESRCWCGMTAYFSHFSSQTRKDGKKTVIYMCAHKHRTFEEVNDPRKGFIKEKKVKPKKAKSPKIETPAADSNK